MTEFAIDGDAGWRSGGISLGCTALGVDCGNGRSTGRVLAAGAAGALAAAVG
ncbi:MAG: hypothetical protein M3Y27_28740 [Acidobacteriota bacterium]|nr:hypothetical protein [Acidobacteriota bacterium]